MLYLIVVLGKMSVADRFFDFILGGRGAGALKCLFSLKFRSVLLVLSCIIYCKSSVQHIIVLCPHTSECNHFYIRVVVNSLIASTGFFVKY